MRINDTVEVRVRVREFKVSVGIRVGVRGNRQMVVFGLVWGFGALELALRSC